MLFATSGVREGSQTGILPVGIIMSVDATMAAMESTDALAVLDANGADGVQERFPAVRRWILMGHSLGGVMAAGYLDGHAQSWDGLVLLGAYSTADLSDDGVTVLSVTGDSDGVLNRRAAADNGETSARTHASSSSQAATTPSSARTARRTVTARRAFRPTNSGPSPPMRWLACSCEGGGAGRKGVETGMIYSPEATNKAVAINTREVALIDAVMTKVRGGLGQASP